jgi:hypothetical protein
LRHEKISQECVHRSTQLANGGSGGLVFVLVFNDTTVHIGQETLGFFCGRVSEQGGLCGVP